MSNISSLVNVNWFLGIPWFVTQPFDLAIVGAAERILGGRVIGYQVGVSLPSAPILVSHHFLYCCARMQGELGWERA
jgi:hypothetical protein